MEETDYLLPITSIIAVEQKRNSRSLFLAVTCSVVSFRKGGC